MEEHSALLLGKYSIKREDAAVLFFKTLHLNWVSGVLYSFSDNGLTPKSWKWKVAKSRTNPKPYCAYFGKNQTNLENHLVREHKMTKIKPCGCQAGILARKVDLLKQTMSARQKTMSVLH